MKKFITAIVLFVAQCTFAQTPISKTIAIQPGQAIRMRFDFPKLIKVSTWDKNEIAITGEVSINGGENDDAFSLESTSDNKTIEITGEVKHMKSLPHRITIWHDGQKIMFKTEEDYKRYEREQGHRSYNQMNWGPEIEIFLVIKVPKNMETKVLSTYGTIEIRDFTGPLVAESTYGGVDAALTEKLVGDLKAEVRYGDIYTNFDSKFTGSEFRDFHTVVNAKPGNGPRYSFESKYGNVYLRKAL